MGGWACAHPDKAACEGYGLNKLLKFSRQVREVLTPYSGEEGRLCKYHRRIVQCSACGECRSCFTCAPDRAGERIGLDFSSDYRYLKAKAADQLGRLCLGLPTSKEQPVYDQFHPLLAAQICENCRMLARERGRAAEAAREVEAARKTAENARRLAEVDAQAPDNPFPVSVRDSQRARRTRSHGSSEPEPETGERRRRSGRLKVRVHCPTLTTAAAAESSRLQLNRAAGNWV